MNRRPVKFYINRRCCFYDRLADVVINEAYGNERMRHRWNSRKIRSMLDYQQFPAKLFRFLVTILIKLNFFPPRWNRHDGDIVVPGSVYQLSTRTHVEESVERRLHQRADQHYLIKRRALLTCHTYTYDGCMCSESRTLDWPRHDERTRRRKRPLMSIACRSSSFVYRHPFRREKRS